LAGGLRIKRLSQALPGLCAAIVLALPAQPVLAAAPSLTATRIQVGQPRTVNPRALPRAKSGAHPRVKIPYLTRDLAAYRMAKARAQAVIGSRTRTAAPNVAANPPIGTLQATSFAAMSMEQQVAAIGADQGLEPPDTQVAAGPLSVVETTNDSMSIWTKNGSRIWNPPDGLVDLNQFFPQIGIGFFFTDPSIMYDTNSRRFFLTGLGVDGSLRSQLFAAVSASSDPLGTWYTYEVTPVAQMAGRVLDQPRLGSSDDKIVMAYDDYQGCQNSATCNFVQDGILVLSKAAMTSGSSLNGRSGFFQVGGSFAILPVRAVTSTSTAYTVENQNLNPVVANAIGFRTIIGNPDSPLSLMLSTASALALSPTWFQPPNAPEPGTNALLQTGDGRITSANWRAGTLWLGLGDGCFPVSGAPTGACLRWLQITTAGPTLSQDYEAGAANDYLYYPALATDAAGNLLAVYTHSSSSVYPSVEASGQLSGNPNTQANTRTIGAGSAAYDSRICGEANRWGDYSGAAMDPADPSIVWVGGEYATDGIDTCDWRTAIGRVAFSATSPVASLYTFSPSPIANSGSLPANAPVSVTLSVRGAGAGVVVWLSFVPTAGGGTASVGGTPLNGAPQSFTTNISGQVTISYHTPVSLPASGTDLLTAADQQSASDVTAIDDYSYAGCPTTLTLAPQPIAPRGALTAGVSVAVVATPKDAAGTSMAGTPIRLSISGTGGGSAHAGPLATPLTSTPTIFNTDTNGQLVISYVTPANLPSSGGSDTITAQTDVACATQHTTSSSYTYAVPTTFYFAEGYTGTGFDESLSMFMPGQSGLAEVDFFTQGGSFHTFAPLTAGLVTSLSVNRVLGANQQVSARVTFPGAGVAERVMHFNNGTWHGSTDIVGVNQTALEWDFAEGSTLSIFAEYLSIQNPNLTTSANITLNYATDTPGVHPARTFTIPAATRVTVAVYAGSQANTLSGACDPLNTCGVGPGIVGVSVQVLSSQPIVAERPFYVMNYSFGSGPIKDGHVAFGANSPGTQWDFAEGTTLSGFNEYLTLQNPGLTAATVFLTYFYDNGVKTVNVPVNGQTRQTVIVNDPAHFGVGAGYVGVSTQVRSTQPIVAERPMYMYWNFGTGPVAGAHDVMGASTTGTLFGFAEASTLTGDNDYLSIENPNIATATVNLAYYLDTGLVLRQIMVAPTSRHTVQIFSSTEGVGTGQHPVAITMNSDLAVLVEKPTYSSNASTYGATDTGGYTPPNGF